MGILLLVTLGVNMCAAQVVFDGGALPAKLITHQQRRARRAEKLEKASMMLAEGNTAAASSAFCATIDVTCGTHNPPGFSSPSLYVSCAHASLDNASILISSGRVGNICVLLCALKIRRMHRLNTCSSTQTEPVCSEKLSGLGKQTQRPLPESLANGRMNHLGAH